MNRLTPLFRLLAACFATTTLTLTAAPNDWPQWRGPNRDGISKETGLLQSWPSEGPKLLWKAQGLGAGFSTVAIADGKIYTTGDSAGSSYVHALDLQGKNLWSTKIGSAGERGGYHGPRGTPTVFGGQIYALAQFGELVCIDSTRGQVRWTKHLAKDFRGDCGSWGYSESPLVDGIKLICTPGGNEGTLIALNRVTGETLWRTTGFTDSAEYASAILKTIEGIPQYIQLTGRSVAGISAADGKVLWKAARRGSTAVIPDPVCSDNQVYVTSGYGVGCNMFHITRNGSEFETTEAYANKVMANHHGGVILLDGHIYGYSDGKGWTCQDLKSGKAVWAEEKLGKGSLTYADNRFYLRSEGSRGTVALIEATPGGYKETGRFNQPDRSDKNSWPHPVVSDGRLYLRDQDILLCYDVRK